MISLSVVAVGNIFSLDDNQQQAFNDILISKQAAKTLMQCAKFFSLKKKYYIMKMKRNPGIINSSPFLQLIEKRSEHIGLSRLNVNSLAFLCRSSRIAHG